jgi:AraC family transcriptional regulator
VSGRSASPWLAAARQFLHDRFDSPFHLSELARAVGVHPVHLSREFARHYGVTMTQYLRTLRLARASELLLTTDHSISRIALSTGFFDHAHFTRVFSQRVGETPSAFRRRCASPLAA